MPMVSVSYSTLFNVSSDLLNSEAQVETRFAMPLFLELGYPQRHILPKESIPALLGNEGSRRRRLEIDYLLCDEDGTPLIVVEVKSPYSNINEHWGQAASYALSHNQALTPGASGIEWLLLTNGLITNLYPHDRSTPIATLRLEDFSSGSPPFVKLKNYLRYRSRVPKESTSAIFDTVPPAELNSLFDTCHDLIWKKEKLSPTDAFYEFCKFVFMKIREDKRREGLPSTVPRSQIPLTSEWLAGTESTSRHPVRDFLFISLRDELEESIPRGKKRIFDKQEGFRLSASTCKELVKRFENINLSAIDEDLNGRMFERFLNQAIRGKELGQYFTPRPVVDFMTRIGLYGREISRQPKVIDACAGTGGFLIEVMAYSIAAIRNDRRLTGTQKAELVQEVCNECLYGVEANERVSRIARINMYLHGDGGSHIFQGDGLDSDPLISPDMSRERSDEISDLIGKILPESFDLILTNPPFSMTYDSKNAEEGRILSQRSIAQGYTKMKSNLLFLDRYYQLLQPGGEILIVIDDTVLNGKTQIKARKWLMQKFIVLGVHSLPFNAFFKAKANIKTSVLHLRKKTIENESQSHVFMSIANNIGHDNHSNDTEERNNLVSILQAYFEWKRTDTLDESLHILSNADPRETLECPQQVWLVPPDLLTDYRLDAFYYSPDLQRTREEIARRRDSGEVEVYKGHHFDIAPKISRDDKAELRGRKVKYFEIGDVTHYGLIVKHTDYEFEELPSRGEYLLRAGDVLMAINNSSRGTVVYVPDEYEGAVCTSGFLVLRPISREQGLLLWYVLRSELCRAQIYYLAQTASQPELKRAVWNTEFMIPMPLGDEKEKALAQSHDFLSHVFALNNADSIRLT
ncbi:MAG: N-6 DNA methylase [Chloroflexota bacterium]|nr:N-6 DNA methylase [Chloroflexota bacterium]